jgi:hypothetical protein
VFPWLSMPKGRMGPPLRSFAADAHDCIMVRVLGPTEYKVVARLIRARSGLPSDRHPDRTKRVVVLEAVKVCLASSEHAARLARRPTLTAPAHDDVSEPRVGTKKRALRSNKETDEGQKICRSGELLDKKSPIQGNRGRGQVGGAAWTMGI